jgi:phytoene dehydrogenase-like protein
MDLLWSGAARYAPFLLKSLETVLRESGLPGPAVEGLGIWTHVAGQTMSDAPSPLAFVPALIHTAGAFYPEEGISAIPQTLERAAKAAGVKFHYSVRVTRIRTENGRTVGVETDAAEFIAAAAVLSNAAAIGAYLELLDTTPAGAHDLKSLPLQSPGVCAYLAVRGTAPLKYLRFRLSENNDRCRLLIQPAAVLSTLHERDWMPARLLAPMAYSAAEQGGPAAQSEYLDSLLEEDWWKAGFTDVRVLGRRIPKSWGSDFNLYADSMNPVMTARFMRQGRIAHRSPYVRRLYFTGSSTHPGQWVSFCAVSGVHAANCIIKDLS